MTDQTVEFSPTPREAVELENAAQRYGPEYLREQEIRTVFNLLNEHTVVMVMGDLGRGKTTFMQEATQFTRQMKKHGRFAHAVNFLDVHELDRHIRLDPLRQKTSSAKDIVDTASPTLDWIDHQPSGEKLKEIPANQRSILFLDAGDALFLEHWGSEFFPAYKSAEWVLLERLKVQPEAQQAYLKGFVRSHRLEHEQRLRSAKAALGQTPPQPSTPEELEGMVQWSLNRFPLYQVFEETREQLLDKITQALKKGRIRVVLTDHGLSRESIRKSGQGLSRQASLYMLDKYEEVFAHAYKYELPASFQADKARLLLQRSLGIDEPQLQDEIIAATGASHKIMKLALTPQVVNQLKAANSPYSRSDTLLKAIAPFQKPS